MVEANCVIISSMLGISISFVGLVYTYLSLTSSHMNYLRLIVLGGEHIFALIMLAKLYLEGTLQRFSCWILVFSAGLFVSSVSTQVFGATQSQQYRMEPFNNNFQQFFLKGLYVHFYFQVLIYSGMLFVLSVIINLLKNY